MVWWGREIMKKKRLYSYLETDYAKFLPKLLKLNECYSVASYINKLIKKDIKKWKLKK
jgi:hypothetical protein